MPILKKKLSYGLLWSPLGMGHLLPASSWQGGLRWVDHWFCSWLLWSRPFSSRPLAVLGRRGTRSWRRSPALARGSANSTRGARTCSASRTAVCSSRRGKRSGRPVSRSVNDRFVVVRRQLSVATSVRRSWSTATGRMMPVSASRRSARTARHRA